MNEGCRNCKRCKKGGTDDEQGSSILMKELPEIAGIYDAETRTMIRNEGAKEGSNVVLLYFRKEDKK